MMCCSSTLKYVGCPVAKVLSRVNIVIVHENMRAFPREMEMYDFATTFEKEFVLKIAYLSAMVTTLSELNCSVQSNRMNIVKAC